MTLATCRARAEYVVHHLAHCETQTCDCSTFKGIGYRYLAMLYASKIGETEDPDITQTMREVLGASVKALWSARSPGGTFPSDWAGGWRSFSSLGGEASAVMTLNIAAEYGL